MFKTIHESRLELVAHTVMASEPQYIDLDDLQGDFYFRNHQDATFMPASAARASFGNEDKTGEDVGKDIKLMNFLAEHKHMTPFEYQHATFLIEVPLFIRSQIHRHRTFSYNEISRRYTSEDLEFWIPDKVRGQSKSNRQASEGEVDGMWIQAWRNAGDEGLARYQSLLNGGVAREIARAVLPQNLITRFYMGGNLRNWAHFIELRRDEHAQYEVQVVANRVAEKLRELWPESCNALGI